MRKRDSADYNCVSMEEPSVRDSLRALAEQAVLRVAESQVPLGYFGGAKALQDPRRDDVFTGLPVFEAAAEALGAVPMVPERYGGEHEWGRLALQFIYGFLGGLSEPTFDAGVFEDTWDAFWGELSEPEWTWVAVANLRLFRSEADLIDLGDDVTVRRRSSEELAGMGWTPWHWEQLVRDWEEGFGFSSHVVHAEHRMPKTPENFVSNEIVTQAKASRALLALRLLKGGDVGMGRMWFLRQEASDLGLLGHHSTAFGEYSPAGVYYELEESELAPLRGLYDDLRRYEDARADAPVSVDLALASFAGSYDRRASFRAETRLVDNVTALEALMGTSTEISFRLAFRVAQVLGDDDEGRVAVFKQMRDYYDTRSRAVHGGTLKQKHHERLQDYETLRGMVRRLLVGFIRLTVNPGHPYTRAFFDKELDEALLHAERRAELRAAMGLLE